MTQMASTLIEGLDPELEEVQAFRAKIIIDPIAERAIRGKAVLEIAPFSGWFTQALFNRGAKFIHCVELNSQAVETLQRRFATQLAENRLRITEADIHHELFRLPPDAYDTIFCTGFLYHTPHVFWILEGMAFLRPKYIFLETSVTDWVTPPDGAFARLRREKGINKPGARQVRGPAVGYQFSTSRDTLIDAMTSLGYSLSVEVGKPPLKLTGIKSPALRNCLISWNRQFSGLFVR